MDAWRAAEVPVLPGRGIEPKIRDTVTGGLVTAASGEDASLYACGITPYDATHMGHAATYTAWDLLVRAWRDAGHEVSYTQNVTDVDDPLLERAERDGDDWWELAQREIARYRADMEALRVLPPTHLIGAVEALPIIDEFTEAIAARGALYDVEGDVYFARGSDPGFGALSGPGTATGLTISEMTELSAERGGDPGRGGKKDPLDPMVWRSERPGEPAWDSRFGRGRPGWHVECAAIAARYLGRVFDVQAGGSDLIFPHHELSASHARVALGTTAGEPAFARVYAHSGLVAYQGRKMSKSLGNLVFVSRLRESGVDAMAIRLALLAHHYRTDWEWTDEVLSEAVSRLARWRSALSASGIRTSSDAPAPAEAPAPADAPAAPSAASSTPGTTSLSRPVGFTSTTAPSSPVRPGASGHARVVGFSRPASTAGPARPGSSPTPDIPLASSVLKAVRERMADDLDAPGAIAVIDEWADAVVVNGGTFEADAALVRDTVDALLGIAL
jgi:L-cysteine:1D-myo-inositol 2-amino-2-deoxy-alpha-D-glucopyranoside ligase